MSENQTMIESSRCGECGKRRELCLCAECPTLSPRTRVLILQHPQEPDKELGSAVLLHRCLANSVLRVGLSWRNLSAALGETADQSKWGVLFLGTQTGSAQALKKNEPVMILSRKGIPIQEALEGIVVLDGNWRQAKALWWRNSWLLKLKRIVLSPPAPSLYGALRKEPRRESVSTLEAVALVLSYLENDPKLQESLLIPFKELLHRYRNLERREKSGRRIPQ